MRSVGRKDGEDREIAYLELHVDDFKREMLWIPCLCFGWECDQLRVQNM